MEKRSRRSSAKVKTGCKTCKIRHVKCDEQRPSCLKCTKTGRRCDGYASPKEDFDVQIWSSGQPPKSQKTISLFPGSDDSVRYLEFYHRYARPMLSSDFDSDFWSRTTLQMAFSEPAVRHALIAVGYLHSTETGTLKHARSKFTTPPTESRTLLQHYNKSVRSLVERMDQPNFTPEIGLVTCLLFVCMEFLRGNYHTAFTHLNNGLDIILELNRRKKRDSIASSPASVSDASSTMTTFSTSTLIEDELQPIFTRAIACAMMYGSLHDKSPHIPGPDLQYYQHLRFGNIRDIQLSFFELRNQAIHQIREIGRQIAFYRVKDNFSDEDVAGQKLVLACQRAWYAALQIYRETHTLSDEDELSVSALLGQYYACYLWLATAMDLTTMTLDAYLHEFKAILYHSKRVLDSMDLTTPQPTARFTFEISIIPVLYFVACRCRCPITRREAVALLERRPPREGLWDVETHIIVAKRTIEIEEREVDPETGWPLERSRLWNTVINADMDQKGGFWGFFTSVEDNKRITGVGTPTYTSEFFHV